MQPMQTTSKTPTNFQLLQPDDTVQRYKAETMKLTTKRKKHRNTIKTVAAVDRLIIFDIWFNFITQRSFSMASVFLAWKE